MHRWEPLSSATRSKEATVAEPDDKMEESSEYQPSEDEAKMLAQQERAKKRKEDAEREKLLREHLRLAHKVHGEAHEGKLRYKSSFHTHTL